jgi:hypothetical protein
MKLRIELNQLELNAIDCQSRDLTDDKLNTVDGEQLVWLSCVRRLVELTTTESDLCIRIIFDQTSPQPGSVYRLRICENRRLTGNRYQRVNVNGCDSLIMRRSEDERGSSLFRGRCDNQSNTLTLTETTRGFIFGDFTPRREI